MLAFALAGAIMAAAAWFGIRSAMIRPLSLDAAAMDLVRPRNADDATFRRGWWRRVASRTAGSAISANRRADLAVLGITSDEHNIDRLSVAVIFASLPLAAAALTAVADASLPAWWLVASAPVGGAVALWYMDQHLTDRATAARREFRFALATYLDLVVTLTRGGAGVETALSEAARVGSGASFEAIRAALAIAGERRETPWLAFDQLGVRLAIPALREFAGAMTMAGEASARVSETLIARARSLRLKELAEAEAESDRASEAMTFPVVAMSVGFLLLISYPALASFLEI